MQHTFLLVKHGVFVQYPILGMCYSVCNTLVGFRIHIRNWEYEHSCPVIVLEAIDLLLR